MHLVVDVGRADDGRGLGRVRAPFGQRLVQRGQQLQHVVFGHALLLGAEEQVLVQEVQLQGPGAAQAALHQRRVLFRPALVVCHAAGEIGVGRRLAGRHLVERVVGPLEGEADQEAQFDGRVVRAEAGRAPAGQAALDGGRGHQLLVRHRGGRLAHHLVQFAVGDAVHLAQVVGVADQHHLGLGAFQLALHEAGQQGVVGVRVLEVVGRVQPARAVHEQGDGEGVDFQLGRVVAPQQHGAGRFLDGRAQVLIGAHILVFGQLDGAVQYLVLVLVEQLAHQLVEGALALAQQLAHGFGVFLLGQLEGQFAQVAGQQLILELGRVGGFTGDGALVLGHGFFLLGAVRAGAAARPEQRAAAAAAAA